MKRIALAGALPIAVLFATLFAALCDCPVAAIADTVYDRIWRVSSPGTDGASLTVNRFGAKSKE